MNQKMNNVAYSPTLQFDISDLLPFRVFTIDEKNSPFLFMLLANGREKKDAHHPYQITFNWLNTDFVHIGVRDQLNMGLKRDVTCF